VFETATIPTKSCFFQQLYDMSLSKLNQLGQGLASLATPTRVLSVRKTESLNTLKLLCQQTTTQSDYTRASSIESNLPIYNLPAASAADSAAVAELQDEWYRALNSGPGAVVLKNFLPDMSIISRANSVFDQIIEKEAASGKKGDHFAAAGSNSRVWNSFQKHAEADPSSFVDYYSNPWLARMSEAWLGPAYQITAQLNVVRPGGKPQSAHRDYHLGFQTSDACARFPASIQIASQYLTLQGGIAHSDVPLDSGHTRLLPFSQLLPEGYTAWRLPEFTAFFDQNWVSLSLGMGDAVFFNPALFHAAGENKTKTVERSVNLLQISSAFGRPMESTDGVKMVRSCWEDLKQFSKRQGDGVPEATDACVKAIGSGYPFPSNLDRRPPGPDGMAPTSETDLLFEGLREDWSTQKVVQELEQIKADSAS
jgi:ectoine hydroxylase-related dioxygenase (phytanoyl-CoA dioxygenase family)